MMEDFNYSMPTKIFYGENIVEKKKDIFKEFGKKALIVTGKNSAKKNGSLDDLTKVLKEENIEYSIFDKIEENPPMELAEEGAKIGKEEKVDFIIGIGGGSPLDSAKGIGVLINNPQAKKEDLYSKTLMESIPVIAIPTTAGTGSEVTQYAIFTNHKEKTKKGFSHKVFPKIALLDAKYLMATPDNVTINTGIDALSHIIEGYLSANANIISDALAKQGLTLFKACKDALYKKEFAYEIREKLMLMSTLGGMVIAQSGTSLPHGMGYALTYFHKIPHGMANGLLLKEYLGFCEDKEKVDTILNLMGMRDLNELGDYLRTLLPCEICISNEEINNYTESMISNKAKLKNHPYEVKREDVYNIYKNSLI